MDAAAGSLPPPLTGVAVTIASTSTTLGFETNESYTLQLDAGAQQLNITAITVAGAMHALTTFGQLITRSPALQVVGVPVMIRDCPRFQHRGLMLDTARHYLQLPTILRTIDGLAQNKLNVLHLHLTDAQSFPYDVEGLPELARRGAYTPSRTYTQADIATIVEYVECSRVWKHVFGAIGWHTSTHMLP
jgi:hexosaminidase